MAIREADLVVPTLRLLDDAPGGFLTTSNLIIALEAHFEPEGEDAKLLEGRHDTKFSQKVRNLVSHRENGRGLETRGLAKYDAAREGWTITDAGRNVVVAVDASV